MEQRRIGQLSVSVVGLGGNNFGTDFFGRKCDEQATKRIIHAALDAGINFIDTAEEYSVDSFVGSGRSEELIGRALGSRRNEVVIATKYSVYDVDDETIRGRARVIRAVEASLRRLGTDRIDLYQQHMPDPEPRSTNCSKPSPGSSSRARSARSAAATSPAPCSTRRSPPAKNRALLASPAPRTSTTYLMSLPKRAWWRPAAGTA
jgi:aryl-alcohol dehydrogenase-like predicted oxidoreductase